MTRTVRQLADRVSGDEEWMGVVRLWTGVDVVAELMADEHVPAQSAARVHGIGVEGWQASSWCRCRRRRASDRDPQVVVG